MATDVPQSATAIRPPATPGHWAVVLAIRAICHWPLPKVPIKMGRWLRRRRREFTRRDEPRCIGPIGPGNDFFHIAHNPSIGPFFDTTHAIESMALIAHLCDDFVMLSSLAQGTDLPNVMRQGF